MESVEEVVSEVVVEDDLREFAPGACIHFKRFAVTTHQIKSL